MKRIARTYLSAVLLLCLAVQFVPLNLIHSHEDHNHAEESHVAISSFDADEYDGVCADQTHHESSEEDCTICDIQQTLNNQAYTVSNQASIVIDGQSAVQNVESTVSADNYLIRNISGRAPPRA